jgi:thioredoxin 1
MAPSGPRIVQVDDSNFESRVLAADKPFLLDLSAEWCQPCKAIAPVIEELSNVYADKVLFGTLDIDNSPQVPTRYQVRSVPTLLMFSGGEVVGQLVGAHPRKRIVELLDKNS